MTRSTKPAPESVLQAIDGLGPGREILRRYVGKSYGAFAWYRIRDYKEAHRRKVATEMEGLSRQHECAGLGRCIRLRKGAETVWSRTRRTRI